MNNLADMGQTEYNDEDTKETINLFDDQVVITEDVLKEESLDNVIHDAAATVERVKYQGPNVHDYGEDLIAAEDQLDADIIKALTAFRAKRNKSSEPNRFLDTSVESIFCATSKHKSGNIANAQTPPLNPSCQCQIRNVTDRQLQCDHCIKIKPTAKKAEKLFKCDKCQKAYTKKFLRRHLLTHEATDQFLCSICPKSFKYRSSLYKNHRYVHDAVKWRNCNA